MDQVQKRNGKIVEFDLTKIINAIKLAFEAQEKQYNDSVIDFLALKVTADFEPKIKDGKIGVEDIQDSVEAVLPRLKAIFEKLGYMESSSADLFDQFLKTGMGAKPLIAAYENQLLEFAVENPEDWAILKDRIVMVYPAPTVWSSHIYIAMDEAGAAGVDALMDPAVQRLAWEKHGFRTDVSGTVEQLERFGVEHIAATIAQAVSMPSYETMERIIAALS